MANVGQITLYKTFVIVFIILSLLYMNLIDSSLLNIFKILCQFFGAITVLIQISWLLANILRNYSHREYISAKNRAVLITGCDSGFGHHLCYRLDSYGFHVFAGVLATDSQSAAKLRTKCSHRLKVIKLDVTLEEDVRRAVAAIEVSGVDLWAVVNNAGVAQFAFLEMGAGIDIFTKTFAVNVFGLVRVTKHCLPLLRRSGGRVVNMASVAGRFTFWGITAYCMSKHAVRAFSDGLRKELTGFGVKVVTIEPNMYKTEMVNIDVLNKAIKNQWLQTDGQIRQEYGGDQFYHQFKRRVRYNLQICRPDIHEVLDIQQKAVTLREPDLYYRCAATLDKPALWLLSVLPESAQDYLLTGRVWKSMLDLRQCKQ